MKKQLSNFILVLMFLTGLGILLYPILANAWNTKVQSQVITDYESVLSSMDKEDYSKFFLEADAFNDMLLKMDKPLFHTRDLTEYDEILTVPGTNVMGYIAIEKIKVEIPIYHGTSAEVLNAGAGHLKGTSFPVGGPGTHCALSAHRGLPSAKLFTDLDKMEIGDTFTITVLDRLLTYQVNQILIVEPKDLEALAIEPDKDYCTLVTCTPYGINTHRLLVRGIRVDNAIEKPKINVKNEANRVNPLWVAPFVSIPVLIIAVEAMMITGRFKKHHSVTGGKKNEKKS